MKRTLIAGAVLLIAACTPVESEPLVIEAMPSTTATTVTTTTRAPTTTTAPSAEDEFIRILAEEFDAYWIMSDRDLIDTGWGQCELMRESRDDGTDIEIFWEIMTMAANANGLTDEEATYYIEIMAVASWTLCPDVLAYMEQ